MLEASGAWKVGKYGRPCVCMTDNHNYLTEIINIWSVEELGDCCNLDHTAGNQTSRNPKVIIYLVANPSLGTMKRQRVSATTPSCIVRRSPLKLCVLLVILVLMFTQSMARNVRPSYEATRRGAPKLTRTLAFSRNQLKSVDNKVLISSSALAKFKLLLIFSLWMTILS